MSSKQQQHPAGTTLP
jgi:hypothetical protein